MQRCWIQASPGFYCYLGALASATLLRRSVAHSLHERKLFHPKRPSVNLSSPRPYGPEQVGSDEAYGQEEGRSRMQWCGCSSQRTGHTKL